MSSSGKPIGVWPKSMEQGAIDGRALDGPDRGEGLS